MRPYQLFRHLGLTIAAIFLTAEIARADLVLETETARIGDKGTGTIGNAVQIERDKDGYTLLTLTAFEFVLVDRLEVLIEPFVYEEQHRKGGPVVRGHGDTELTLSYVAFDELGARPEIVFAFKTKAPTASSAIGTGKYDFTYYVVLGKKIGEWDFNGNIAFETFGSPAGTHLKNQLILDLSADRSISQTWSLYIETFGNSNPEAGVKRTIAAAIGLEHDFTKHTNAFTSLGFDTDHLTTFRVGVNYTW